MVGEERAREIGVGELLDERDEDQRQPGGELERPHGPRRLLGGRVRGAAGLMVGRPAARPGEQDEHGKPEEVDALEDRRDAELEHAERAGGEKQDRPGARVPAGDEQDRGDGHRRAQGESGHVRLEVHRGRQVDAERQQPDQRDADVQAHGEGHEGRHAGEERRVDARANACQQAHKR